jgi:arylsulfatase A-like enzyme
MDTVELAEVGAKEFMNKKPNILMIVTDQEYAHQPMPADFALHARDRIRARGVTFNHHHCSTACSTTPISPGSTT